MSEAKKRSEQHLIEADGEQLLASRLPRHWVLRPYRPDYGLDFAIEVFRDPSSDTKAHLTYETLGEHVFIQLKTAKVTKSVPLKIYGRGNVEKSREVLKKNDLVGQMETIRLSVDTSELMTVERMGVAVPVLLVIADLTAERCYFCCLNDYIDKILIPRYDDYTATNTRTIHVPLANEIGEPIVGVTALRWYAKRAKLYCVSALHLSGGRTQLCLGHPQFLPMARYFASRIVNYDFWDDTEMWELIGYYGSKIRHFLQTGQPDLMGSDTSSSVSSVMANLSEDLRLAEILELWRLLAALPRTYEDDCREWFLPTAIGYAASYPTHN